jgi:hypothetical protein
MAARPTQTGQDQETHMGTHRWHRTKTFWLIVAAAVVPFGWAIPQFEKALAHAIARRPTRLQQLGPDAPR